MNKRLFAIALGALTAGSIAGHMALGASGSPSNAARGSYPDWWRDVTVLAVAPDGTWGVGTDKIFDSAVARALADCKRKYRREIGCGYQQTAVRAGWSVMFRCGGENIIAAERRLADAIQQARRQEIRLRMHYQPDMSRCERIVTVDPRGSVV
ncbi:MAG: hypothetical protein AB7P12_05595 [Alphaproteobacteria bacterium]